MPQKLDDLPESASQTAGPYVHIGLAPEAAGLEGFPGLGRDIAGPHAKGERIRVEGSVFDGTGTPLTDVLIEVWQANVGGIYASPGDPRHGEVEEGFRGWGRAVPDFATGRFSFETIKPGATAEGTAPHLTLWLVARGINIGLHTRMYFSDEADANAGDPVLNRIEQTHRRETLIARREEDEDDHGIVYRFDIHLQGDKETVFLDV